MKRRRKLHCRSMVATIALTSLALSDTKAIAQGAGEKWATTWSTATVGRPQYPPPVMPQSPAFMANQCPARAPVPVVGQAEQTYAPLPFMQFANQTLRQIVHVSVGGERVRVVVSNAQRTLPLVIGGAAVAIRSADSEVQSDSVRPLMFSGRSTISIPAHAVAYSDAVQLNLPPMADLAIDLYLPGSSDSPSPVTMHNVALQTSYVSETGNHVGKAILPAVATTESWFYIARVEVIAPRTTSVVVAFGDSLTDGGARSRPDRHNRWVDQLLRRVRALPAAPTMSLANAGVGGSRVLADGSYVSGLNAMARFDADVLMQAGATHVVIAAGLNDIGGARHSPTPTAEDVIAGYRQLIERAHSSRLRVIGATLTPFWGAAYYTDVGEAKRQAVNSWIRTSGAFDGFVDFDLAVRDPADPKKLLAEFDSCDHLHPNESGYRAMAAAFDLRMFWQ